MGVCKIRMVTHSGVWMMMMMACLEDVILAGPARGSGRTIREVYPEIEPEKLEGNQAEVCIVGDVVYGAEESVPADQPCLSCKCQPPGVRCVTTECLKKPGCRAIHKSNKCCPEYQCECEYEGRLYANGERLETSPGGECKVCYCRGGEVQCAEVSCYIRTDCEGRAVPGQCCPKYDHCPPREPLIDRAPPYTPEPPSTLEYWSILNTSLDGDQQSTPGYDMQDISNKITDVKEEEFHVPKITIQEIIPEIKEIPITGPPKREITFKHAHIENDSRLTNNVEDLEKETSKENGNISDLSTGDAEVESSEISEVFHHPPPVLKIGDRLLFLKQGELVPGKDSSTPLPVITIIGAEGLQRGTEDSGEYREIPSQVQHPSNEYMPVSEDPVRDDLTTEITHIISFVRAKNKIEDTTGSSLSTIQDFLLNLTRNGLEATDSQEGVSDGSTSILTEEIVNKIKSLTNAESTTDVSHLIQRIFIADINDTDSETTTFSYSDQNITAGSEVENNATEMRYEDLGESKIDQNPEYPPIPDIMSSQNLDELSEHSDSESGISDKTSYATTNGTFENGSHPLINPKASLPERLLIGLAPSDNNTEDIDNSTLTERSVETVESMSDESGEATTSKNRQASIISSSEDASVETVRPNAGEAQKIDVKDLVETISGYDVTTEPMRFNGTARPADVETIENPENLRPQLTKKTESELIFEQLNEELKSVPARTFYIGSSGGEEAEAEAIFKELLADTSTGSPSNAQDGKETELMERVSDAISKFQTKQQPKESLDVSILGLLRDFFGAQPKPQLKKEQ